ncbi:MAG: Gfo/Idh/MocA family oxidoreductase [Rhodobiaceae bacterium]|nr:Gfo/Idh/MocA family oxidoreductase [Rhodobiaceae bacterium]
MTGRTARIAVVGAGLIGTRHADAIAASKQATLACIVDPAPAGEAVAGRHGVPAFRTLDEMIAAGGVDGVFLATPNQLHAEGALACIAAGLPVLIEKPITSDPADARRILEAAAAKGVPVATGHHRRHNPLIAKAKSLIDDGRLGTIASVHAMTWFHKPDDYFDVEWRRKAGAGPVYINLIHDIDLLLHFCGPVAEVQAMESNAVRGNEVEDTAVILLRFRSGALGTVNVSDTAVAPWSWELTARENPAYPATPEDCYWIAGTHGSLSLPNLALWSNPAKRSWWEPISATKFPFEADVPLVRQADQFARVVLDSEMPLVTGADGLAALEVITAVKASAATGKPVALDP